MTTMISPDYVKSLAKKGLREDGRNFEEFRKPVTVEYSLSPRSAAGSAKVKIGDTEVIAGVKFEINEPYPDSPDKGSMMVMAELTPLASPEFETGPPSIKSIELARVVDRGIRESGALNFKKLCIKEGEKIWFVIIDIYPINAAGNLFDASALAATAALKDAKFPATTKELNIDHEAETTKESLPLNFMPISCTIHKIADKLYVDTTEAEEEASEARLTVVFTDEGKICAMQKGGEKPLTEDDLNKMVELAHKKSEELRSAL